MYENNMKVHEEEIEEGEKKGETVDQSWRVRKKAKRKGRKETEAAEVSRDNSRKGITKEIKCGKRRGI